MRFTSVRGKSDILSRALTDKHHYYEIMAKDSYAFVHDVATPYWKVVPQQDYSVGSEQDLIKLNVYPPYDDNIGAVSAVIAFNGTDWGMRTDIQTDLNKVSPGLDKFIRHETKITEILKSLFDRYGKVVVTGYSLGGCYAQYTALRNWKYVLKVITFQSPPVHSYFESLLLYQQGFNLSTAEIKKVKDASYHYLVEGDPVPGLSTTWSNSGKHMPGHIFNIKFMDIGAYDPAEAHTKYIFAEFINHNSNDNRYRLFPIARHLNQASIAIEFIDYQASNLGGLEGPNIARINHMYAQRSAQFLQAIIDARRDPRVSIPANVLAVWITLGRLSFATLFYLNDVDYYIVYLWDQYTLSILSNRNSLSDYLHFRIRVLGINPTTVLENEQKVYLKNNFSQLFLAMNPELGNYQYIDSLGYLTDSGLRILRLEDPRGTGRLSNPVIKSIFKGVQDPHTDYDSWLVDNEAQKLKSKRSRWQERLVKKEIINYFQLVALSDHNHNPIPNVYQPGSTPLITKAYLISGIAISTILSRLLQIFTHYTDTFDPEFDAYVATSINFPPIAGDTDDSDLLTVSKYRYLYVKMRNTNLIHYDEQLTKAYYKAHCHYLDGLKTDPLGLLPDEVRQQLHRDDEFSVRSRPQLRRQIEINYSMTDFRTDALNASRRYRDRPKTQVMQNIADWYGFLFAGFRGFEDRRSGGWLAEAFLTTGAPESAMHQDIEGGRLETLKTLRRSIPDLIVIRPESRSLEIIDPTYRFDEPYHNFKTVFYMSILRQYLPGWEIKGVDHRNAREQTLI